MAIVRRGYRRRFPLFRHGQYRYRQRPYVRYHPHQFHIYNLSDTAMADTPDPQNGALADMTGAAASGSDSSKKQMGWSSDAKWLIIVSLVLVGLIIAAPIIGMILFAGALSKK